MSDDRFTTPRDILIHTDTTGKKLIFFSIQPLH